MRTVTILVILTTALSLAKPACADPAEKLRLCDLALTSCESEIETLKKLLEAEQQMGQMLKKQRDQALDKMDTSTSFVPWFMWVIMGAAGGVILTRGLR